jgi:transposase
MEEAVRDLLRAREDLLEDRLRARHRTRNFLQRQARQYGKKLWGVNHELWLKAQKFDYPALSQTFETYLRKLDEANAGLAEIDRMILGWAEGEEYKGAVKCLRCFKRIDTLGAITILAEAQDLTRFGSAREFMSYTGLVGSEYSSGKRVIRGGITKAGNAHIRRILVESAWSYRHRNVTSSDLLARRKGCPTEAVKIARKAQDRLTNKFWRMTSKGKKQPVVVVAIARELAGFIWSMSRCFPAKAV